jgi:hypothetical protein
MVFGAAAEILFTMPEKIRYAAKQIDGIRFVWEGAASNMSNKNKDSDIDREWDNRVLCSDESCIGTIGADGCCRECGRTFEGDLSVGFQDVQENNLSIPDVEQVSDTRDSRDTCDTVSGDETQDPDVDPDDQWERRTLCIDESCIGVVDEADGCCKECGKPYPKA